MSGARTNGSDDDVQDLQARLDAIRDDLKALQGDMRGLANGVGDAASERAADMLRTAEAMASELSEDVEDWANDNIATLRETIREQPFLACGLAMSAGAIFGALLLRR
jgi:ElaB/YqjD/DUF883 family membrane-anchored ribosome-binding protein